MPTFKVQVGLSFTQPTYDLLAQQAEAAGMSKTAYIIALIESTRGAQAPTPPPPAAGLTPPDQPTLLPAITGGKEQKLTISLRLGHSIYRVLMDYCAARKQSPSQVMRHALFEFLRVKREQPPAPKFDDTDRDRGRDIFGDPIPQRPTPRPTGATAAPAPSKKPEPFKI